MGKWVRNKKTGESSYMTDSGQLVANPERPGLIVQAGRQMHDLWGGMQTAGAYLTRDQEALQRIEAETAERNRMFEAADELYPIESMVGQALPGLATAPLSAAGLTGFGLNVGLGAAETALDVGEGGSAVDRAQAGALGAIAGDVVARTAGRILNTANAIGDAMSGKVLRRNPDAQQWVDVGGQTLAYQNMEPGTLGQSFAESVTKGAQASVWGAPHVKQAWMDNEALMNATAAEAVGTPLHTNGLLDKTWRKTALDRFQRGFAEVAGAAQGKNVQLAGPLRSTLNKIKPIEDLKDFGLFQGLEAKGSVDAAMTGREWLIARKELASYAARTESDEYAQRLYGLIDELDTSMERNLGPDFTELFANLREQYRTFIQLEKPGVINRDGNISIPRLASALDNKTTGYGRTATAGTKPVFPETQRLLDVVEAGDKTQFMPFKSSGTAENQALRELGKDVGAAAQDGGVSGVLGLIASQGAPFLARPMEAGGGLPYDALINRSAPAMFPKVGQGVGRSGLDEMFYPFVGHKDDRPQ